MEGKKAGVHLHLQNVCGGLTYSVPLFGVVGVDVGESDVFLLRAFFVTRFSLHVVANHQLVDHHANDGAEERGENGHKEPAVSRPEEQEGKE